MPTLHWLTRDEDIQQARRAPYRLLEVVPELSAGDPNTGNMLIQGDNLEALKALLPYYAGRVKCVFIDPPYNTKSAFEHYDDNLEHSQWLAMMYPRLELLRQLLSENGSIWITIDDNEAHHLKVVCDEIFGRVNFIGNVIWEKADSPRMDAQFFSVRHDHLLVFAKNIGLTTWNKLPVTEAAAHYDKIDEEGFKYYLKPLRAMGGQGDSRAARPTLYYPLVAPDGTEVYPKRQDGTDGAWRWNKKKVAEESDRIEWIKGRKGWVPYYRIYAEANSLRPPETIWRHDEVGSNRTSKKEIKELFPDSIPFGTPKPERLIERILCIATDSDDLVLDSFLGSGTTAAVAQKIGRQYVGIEMGDHAVSHCVSRLRKVVAGEQGGISQFVGWRGGGGFRFYRLGGSAFDDVGSINPNIRFPALAAHVWFSETGQPYEGKADKPFLGIHDGTAYALLYNGILGDKRVDGGNVLTTPVLDLLRSQAKGFAGPWVIYGEMSRLSKERLAREDIVFKQTPYDVRAR